MNKEERKHYDRLSRLGCIACLTLGYGYSPSEIHHLRYQAGAGKKSDFNKSIPLCPHHHRLGGYGVAIHAGRRAFEEAIGMTELELLEKTLQLLKDDNETFNSI